MGDIFGLLDNYNKNHVLDYFFSTNLTGRNFKFYKLKKHSYRFVYYKLIIYEIKKNLKKRMYCLYHNLTKI